MKIKKRGGKNWNWWDCGAKNEFNSGQFFFSSFLFFFYLNFFVFFSAKEADKSLYFTLGPRKKCCCKETKKNERDQTRKAHDPADAAVVGSEKVCRPKNRFQLQDEWIEGKERIGKKSREKKLKKNWTMFQFWRCEFICGGTFDDDTKCQKLETGLLLHLKEFREQKGHWHERNWLRMNGILAGETGGPISGFFVVSTCFMSSCRESADPCPKLAIVGSTWWRIYGQLCIDEQLPLSLQLFAIFAGTGSQWEERNGEE